MGSGKTSIIRQFIERRNFEVEFIEVFGKLYPYSIDKKRNIVATGRYDRAVCGGIDGIIKNKDLMKEYLIKIIKQHQPSLVLFEAVMYGITFQFSNDLNNIVKKFGYDYIAIAPIAPIDVLLDRISIRNSGKPFNIEFVEKQYTRYLTSTKKLLNNGVKVKIIDSTIYSKQEMYKVLEAIV